MVKDWDFYHWNVASCLEITISCILMTSVYIKSSNFILLSLFHIYLVFNSYTIINQWYSWWRSSWLNKLIKLKMMKYFQSHWNPLLILALWEIIKTNSCVYTRHKALYSCVARMGDTRGGCKWCHPPPIRHIFSITILLYYK